MWGGTLCGRKLTDDAMHPKFLRGDAVIGVERPHHQELHQKYCLVSIKNGELLCRKAIYLKDNLMFIALDERVPSFVLKKDAKVYEVFAHFLGNGPLRP